jgi:hypothetical protein
MPLTGHEDLGPLRAGRAQATLNRRDVVDAAGRSLINFTQQKCATQEANER